MVLDRYVTCGASFEPNIFSHVIYFDDYQGFMDTKQLEQTYVIKAPLTKVWQALTDAKVAEQWGAGPAKVDAHEGGEFSYWNGDIHGVNTKVVPEKLLEQDWYGHDNPT